jgi:hypothetical protein
MSLKDRLSNAKEKISNSFSNAKEKIKTKLGLEDDEEEDEDDKEDIEDVEDDEEEEEDDKIIGDDIPDEGDFIDRNKISHKNPKVTVMVKNQFVENYEIRDRGCMLFSTTYEAAQTVGQIIQNENYDRKVKIPMLPADGKEEALIIKTTLDDFENCIINDNGDVIIESDPR